MDPLFPLDLNGLTSYNMSLHSFFLNLFASLDVSDVDELSADFMYEGFSAEVVMEHLKRVKDEKNISDADFSKDIKLLVIIAAVMGNVNAKNREKISDSGKNKVTAILEKYGLSMGGAGGKRATINLPRVSATFPILTVTIVKSMKFERNYGNVFLCHSLPKFMKTSTFPGVIPQGLNSKVRDVLLIASTCYSSEQTIALKRDTKKYEDVLAAYSEQVTYVNLSHNSPIPGEDERMKFIKTLTFDVSAILTVVAKYAALSGVSVADCTTTDFTNAGLLVKV